MSDQPSQAQILAALSSGSWRSKAPPSTSTFSELQSSAPGNTGLVTAESSKNARKIYCFREGCGSLILLSRVGDWVPTPSAILPHDPASPFPPPLTTSIVNASEQAPDLGVGNERGGLWHVPTPFDFENVGYSRPADGASLPPHSPGVSPPSASGGVGGEDSRRVKWLICAECDLGPIGYGFEGGKEAWIDAERVRYAADP